MARVGSSPLVRKLLSSITTKYIQRWSRGILCYKCIPHNDAFCAYLAEVDKVRMEISKVDKDDIKGLARRIVHQAEPVIIVQNYERTWTYIVSTITYIVCSPWFLRSFVVSRKADPSRPRHRNTSRCTTRAHHASAPWTISPSCSQC